MLYEMGIRGSLPVPPRVYDVYSLGQVDAYEMFLYFDLKYII